MSKKLALAPPIIKNFQRDAYPLSVMAAHTKNYLPWVYSNYLQIMSNHDTFLKWKRVRVMYFNSFVGFQSPFIEKNKLSRSYLETLQVDMIDFIRKNIDNDFYFVLSLDEFHLPSRPGYQKHHFLHDIMIFGYGPDHFNVIGYNREGVYADTTISFDAFSLAYNTLKPSKKEWWNDLVIVFKCNHHRKYAFNKVLYKQLLHDYLLSINTAAYTQEEYAQKELDVYIYGIQIYACLKENLKLSLKKERYFDYMPMHFLMEHKQLIASSIRYMQENRIIKANLYNDYKQNVANPFRAFLHVYLKAGLTRNRAYVEKILNEIDSAIDAEKRALQVLYDVL